MSAADAGKSCTVPVNMACITGRCQCRVQTTARPCGRMAKAPHGARHHQASVHRHRHPKLALPIFWKLMSHGGFEHSQNFQLATHPFPPHHSVPSPCHSVPHPPDHCSQRATSSASAVRCKLSLTSLKVENGKGEAALPSTHPQYHMDGKVLYKKSREGTMLHMSCAFSLNMTVFIWHKPLREVKCLLSTKHNNVPCFFPHAW